VIFVTSALVIGGAERQWVTLLAGLAERGFDVRLLTLVDEGPFFHEVRSRGIDVSCAHMSRRTDLRGLRRAFRSLGYGPDLVVSQSVNAQTVGAVMARKARVPHVTIDHAGPGLALRLHQRLLLRAVAPTVDLLIAVSPLQLERLLTLGFRRDRIAFIPNAVEQLVPTEGREEARKRLGVDETDVVALLVADLRPVKEAHLFVEAVTRAHRRDVRVKGFVAGSGPEFERVAEAASRSDGAVQMLGARLDVPDLMNAADIVCLSSATEALPMTLLEAMSLGRAVIATAVGGVTEIVVNEKTGILVPSRQPEAFAEAILRLAADPLLQLTLGKAGRARQLEKFDVAPMIDAYAEALESVIARRQSRATSR
jgi:glycosyltransferase involved in cell wall biosynthesis